MYSQQREINEIVTKDMETIKEVARNSKHFDTENMSLVLFGSYGRGEGGGINGKPVNDYDLLLVGGNEEIRREIEALDLAVPAEVHMVDSLDGVECTQQWFEIAHASTHLIGTPFRVDFSGLRIQELLPDWEAWDIPYADAVNSIDRRVVSMLVGKYEMMKDAPDWHKVLTQIGKMIFALGDAQLIKRGEFAPSYRTRALMLFQDEIAPLYTLATSFKILGTPHLSSDQIWGLWMQVQGMTRTYVLENELRTQFGELLFAMDESVSHSDLKQILVNLGAEKWLGDEKSEDVEELSPSKVG